MAKSITLTLAFTTAQDIADLQDSWLGGKDFRMSTTGQYCSIRNYKQLKQDYDSITIRAFSSDREAIFERCIWTHPLAGITTYV